MIKRKVKKVVGRVRKAIEGLDVPHLVGLVAIVGAIIILAILL